MTTEKIVLRKLKELNTIWHPKSGLVFKSREEKVVTGRYIDGALIELDDTAIQLVEQWGFKIDESLLEEEEQVTEEQVTDEEQVTEEQVTDEGDEDVNVSDEGGADEDVNNSVTKVFQDTQNVLYKLYVDIAAASLQNVEENSSLKSTIKDLQSEVDQLKRSIEVITRDRDDKESKLSNLKSLLG